MQTSTEVYTQQADRNLTPNPGWNSIKNEFAINNAGIISTLMLASRTVVHLLGYYASPLLITLEGKERNNLANKKY